MKQKYTSILIVISVITFIFPLNLTLHDYDNPSASHILDVDIHNDLLIVSGMIGGIEFYDISNPEILYHINNLQLLGGGGGGGTKPNCIVASGNYVYVTTNRGLGIINISNTANPQYLGIVAGSDNYILENLDVLNNVLAVSAHEDGVLVYDISSPLNPQLDYILPSENSWTVRLDNDYIYVGDENTLIKYEYNNIQYIDSLELSNSIKDIYIGNYIYIAIGSDGVAILDTVDFSLLDVYNTSTLANRIDISNVNNHDIIAVSDWDDVEILEYVDNQLQLFGYKNTNRRTMAIASKDNYIYSAEWASIQIFEYGEIDGPDIDLDVYELNYPYVVNGSSLSLSIEVTNNGNDILNIIDAYTTNNEFTFNTLNNLNSGESQIINILYSANSINASGSYRIFSNDADEYEVICETNGNINGANIGDIAPNFNLPIIANGNGLFQLSDYLGKVIILAFFAPN